MRHHASNALTGSAEETYSPVFNVTGDKWAGREELSAPWNCDRRVLMLSRQSFPSTVYYLRTVITDGPDARNSVTETCRSGRPEKCVYIPPSSVIRLRWAAAHVDMDTSGRKPDVRDG